jgi:hypothetical protein
MYKLIKKMNKFYIFYIQTYGINDIIPSFTYTYVSTILKHKCYLFEFIVYVPTPFTLLNIILMFISPF